MNAPISAGDPTPAAIISNPPPPSTPINAIWITIPHFFFHMPTPRTPIPLPHCCATLALVLTFACSVPAAENAPPTLQPAPAQIDPARALFDEAASPQDREAAADSLIRANTPPAIDLLANAIKHDTPPGSRAAVLAAIENAQTPPPAIIPALAEYARIAASADLVPVLRAIARFHSRDAVTPVIDRLLADPSPQGDPLNQLVAALRLQTGRTDLPPDPAHWREWWNRAQWLPANQWQSALLSAQGEAVRQSTQQLTEAYTRLVGIYSRLHLLTPTAERSPLIVELLTETAEPLRALGLDLAERALLNAEPVEETVAVALENLLADASPRVRARAASVLDTMALPSSTPPLTDALARETEPTAAIPLLRAAARRGAPAAAPDVVRWIERDSPARATAIQAIADLLAAGFSPNSTTRDRLLAALLPTLDDDAPPARAWEVLARMGRSAELAAALHDQEADRANAAAAALLPLPAHTRTITDAALERPLLAPLAVLAIRMHNPTAEGYRTIYSFLPQDPDERAAVVDQFVRAMPPIERSAAAARDQDPANKLLLLAFAEDPAALASVPNPQAVIASRLDLLLQTAQHEVVLQSIQALPENTDRTPFAPQRVRALLRLLRFDEAAAASTAPAPAPALAEVWLDELTNTNHPARAAELAVHIRTLFDTSLTTEQRSRLDTIAPPTPTPPQEAPPQE